MLPRGLTLGGRLLLVLERPEQRPRLPRRGGIGRARRHALERRLIGGDALERAERHVAEVAPQRRGDKFRGVGQALERSHPHGFDLRATADRAERLLVASQPSECRAADRFALGRLGHEHEVLLGRGRRQRAERVERGEAGGFVGFVGAERDVEQDACGFVTDALVGVAAEGVRQHGHRAQLADRGPPHARVVVFAHDRGQQILLVFRDLLHTCRTNCGVAGLPLWLRLESVENAHR